MDHHSPGSLYLLRVTGLNPATVEDTLRNFVEAKTDREVEDIEYTPDRGEAIVSLLDAPDANGLDKVRRTKVGGRYLEVSEILEPADQDVRGDDDMLTRVMVSGLDPATPEEDLWNYLEVVTDTEVTNVQFENGGCSALVTFTEEIDLKKVTRKSMRKLKGVVPELSAPRNMPERPTQSPAHSPALSPAHRPSQSPTMNPAERPTHSPAHRPSQSPTKNPAERPALTPAHRPSQSPTMNPAERPTQSPARGPCQSPNKSLVKIPGESLDQQDIDTDLETDWSVISCKLQTDMKSHSDQRLLQNSVKLTNELRQKMNTNPSLRKFGNDIFNLWDLDVEGLDPQGTLSNWQSYRSREKRMTGSEFDSLSPSTAEFLLQNEMTELVAGVFIHSDDNAGRLYLVGDGDRAEEAVERLQMMLKNKNKGIHCQGGPHQGVANGGVHTKGNPDDDAVDGNGKRAVTSGMPQGHHPRVSTDSTFLQAQMPYSESVELGESVITALKQNSYMRNYVTEQLRELNIQIVLADKNAVTVSTMSPTEVCKAKQLIQRLVVVKHVDLRSESILQFRSIEDIKTYLLNQHTFQRKVFVFNDQNILHLICTNDVLPIVDIEIETMTSSFERRTCQNPGEDIDPTELERHIQGDSLINHRIKIIMDNKNISLFAHSDDICQAKRRLDEYLCEKEDALKPNAAIYLDDLEDFPYIDEESFEVSMKEHVESDDDSFSSKAACLDEVSLMRRDELLTDLEKKERLISESEDLQTLIASTVEHLMDEEITTMTSVDQQSKKKTSTSSDPPKLVPPSGTKKKSPQKDNEPTTQTAAKSKQTAAKSKTVQTPKAMTKLTPRLGKKSSSSTTYQSGCASGRKISVKVYKADITQLQVDVIVSAANNMLLHGGGVSRAIAKGAGPALEKECQEFLNKFGPVKITDLAVTSAGRLPCKKVYHAVGPHWTEYQDKVQCLQDLCHTIIKCLCRADSQGMRSIAISAISAGIFRVPLELCAKMYVRALKSFDSAKSKGNLKEVHFVDVNENVVSTIQKTLQDVWNNPLATTKSRKDHDFIERCLQDGSPVTAVVGSHPQSPVSEVEEPEAPAGCFKPDSLTLPLLDLPSDDGCAVCLGVMTSPKKITCGHTFCTSCIDQCFSRRMVCPICYTVCGEVWGVMPTGCMEVHLEHFDSLPGYEQDGTIVINYSFKDGIQTDDHPHPKRGYKGTSQTAYLPDNATGMQVLNLLKIAWARHLTFTIDEGTVTWNGIQHKTKTTGGPINNGYPDPSYLARVQQQCASFGIVIDSL